MPPKRPLGGRETQVKSIPPERRLSRVTEKSRLPVSEIAKKSKLYSLLHSAMNKCLAKSRRPLLLKNIPFMRKQWEIWNTLPSYGTYYLFSNVRSLIYVR